MRIGAHVSSAGGHHLVFERAREIGAEAVQLFISAPQQWKTPSLDGEQLERFNRLREASGLPAFFHGEYLVNLGSQDEALLARSAESLRSYHHFAGQMGAVGTIFHVGSHLGAGFDGAMVERIAGMLRDVLDAEPDNPSLLILENNAGQGNCIGGKFGERGAIIRALGGHPRGAVCMDTCHIFSAGYDIENHLEEVLDDFDRLIGLDRLKAIHLNDSKMPFGDHKDRHEKLGEGLIGPETIARFVTEPRLAAVPLFLETPNDNDGYAAEIRRVRLIRKEAGID